jgi:two-component system sensor histidine kinase/response regulator
MANLHLLWNRFLSAGTTGETTPCQRNKISITRGSSFFLVALGPLFALANLAQGYFPLAFINLLSTAVGLACLWLVRRSLVRAAALLLVLGCCAIFFYSAWSFHNGMEYTLLLGMLAAVFMFDAPAARISLAALNAGGFLTVKILHFDPSVADRFPLSRLTLNIVIFLVGYYFTLEIIRAVHRNHQRAIEQRNAELSESRRRLDEEHRELAALTNQLQVANQAKERLFSLVAHDLRGPVGNLKNALELLNSRDLTPQDFQEMTRELKVGVDLAYECLDTLLLWSARQMREIKPVFAEVALEPIARDALALLGDLAAFKNISIRQSIPSRARVWADPTQVASVFRNLLSNALKFTPAGGRVEIFAREDGDFWSIAVSDTGVGMNPDQVRRISQADAAPSHPGTDNEKGFGLGLQICHEFVKSNRGTLSVESQVGQGSTFRFSLPSAERKNTGLPFSNPEAILSDGSRETPV